MKRTLKILAIVCAALLSAFAFVGCKEKEDGIKTLTAEDKYLLITATEGASGNLLSLMQE